MPRQPRTRHSDRMSSRSSSPGYQELGTTLPNRARQEDTDREIIEIIDSSDEEDNPASRPNLSVSNTTCLPCPSSNSAAPPSMTDYSSPTETPVLRRSTRNKPTKSYKSNRGKRAKASISRQDSSSTSSAQKRRSLSPTPLNPSAPKKANLSKDAEDERTPTKGNARALDPKTPSCSSSFMFVDVPNRTHAQASSSSTVLEKDTGSLRAKFALLEAKHADLEAKYACIAAEHTVLETEHAMLKTEHALLETRASVLESENMALSADRDGLQHYAKKTEEYLTCGVCMDIHLRPFTLDPCGHNCCLRCLHSWLATNRTCPLCAVNIKKAFPNTDMGSLAQLLVEQFPAKGHDEDDLGEAETLFLLTREGSSDRNFVRLLPRHARRHEDDESPRDEGHAVRFGTNRPQLPGTSRSQVVPGHHARPDPAPLDHAERLALLLNLPRGVTPSPEPRAEPPRTGGGLFHWDFLLGR